MSAVVAIQEALTFRPIELRDAAGGLRLSQAVSWPYRVEDWQMAIGLGGGVVATRGEDIVATALWWPYGQTYATLGMIIVSPDLQGGGIGRRLMQGLLEQSAGRTLLLNATVAGEPLYEKLGFVSCGGVRQHHGIVPALAAPVLSPQERLRPAGMADLPLLERLDLQATGLPRRPLLEVLLGCGQAIVLERDGMPVGFSILRRFGRGLSIGPVIANDSAQARILIDHWLHAQQGQFVRIDIPVSSGLDAWATQRGLKFAGPVTTMVRGDKPLATGPAILYGLVNQALG